MPVHLILLDFVARIIFGWNYVLWSFSLCSILQSCYFVFLVQMSSLAPCSPTPSAYFLPVVWEITFHNHTINRQNYGSVLIISVFYIKRKKIIGWVAADTYFTFAALNYKNTHKLMAINCQEQSDLLRLFLLFSLKKLEYFMAKINCVLKTQIQWPCQLMCCTSI